MTNAIRAYLATPEGADYITSDDYEQRRQRLAEKMAAGPVSFAEMAETLGLPLAVVVDLVNAWQAEREASHATKH